MKRKDKPKEVARTLSVSAAVPDDDGDEFDGVLDDDDEANVFQLQVKANKDHTSSDTRSTIMEMVAIPTQNEKDFGITIGEYCITSVEETRFTKHHVFLTAGEENVESSVTMFVNEGFVDTEESKVDLDDNVSL